PITDFSVTVGTLWLQETLQASAGDVALTGFQNVRTAAVAYDATVGTVTVTVSLQGTIAGTVSVTEGTTNMGSSAITGGLAGTLPLVFALASDGVTLPPTTATLSTTGLTLAVQFPDSILGSLLNGPVQDQLTTQISGQVATLATASAVA